MKTEAQARANAKYQKEKTKMLSVQLITSKDKDIISFLESVPSKQAYIKKLIRMDIERMTK